MNRLKKLNMRKVVTLLALIGVLSGCAGVNGRFGCNATASSSCTPVSEINAMAEGGYFDGGMRGARTVSLPIHASSRERDTKTKLALYKGMPVRDRERIQKIWIAPYQDLRNDYHTASYVYTVLLKPHWAGDASKELNATEGGD